MDGLAAIHCKVECEVVPTSRDHNTDLERKQYLKKLEKFLKKWVEKSFTRTRDRCLNIRSVLHWDFRFLDPLLFRFLCSSTFRCLKQRIETTLSMKNHVLNERTTPKFDHDPFVFWR